MPRVACWKRDHLPRKDLRKWPNLTPLTSESASSCAQPQTRHIRHRKVAQNLIALAPFLGCRLPVFTGPNFLYYSSEFKPHDAGDAVWWRI